MKKENKKDKILCDNCKFAIWKEYSGTDESYIYLSKCLKDNNTTSWGEAKCKFYRKRKNIKMNTYTIIIGFCLICLLAVFMSGR